MKYLAVASLAAMGVAVSDGKCRVLVLSGGSNNGAWESGVIWGLLHYGNPADFAWDAVSGVSAGAINTGGIATWATGDELAMSEWLSDTWENMTNEKLFIYRDGSYYDLLFKEPSFIDDTPALATLKDIVDDTGGAIKRNFTVSAVDANTGEYIAMSNKNTPYENLAQSALSSGSLPGILLP